eukprot:11170806-Lingulodinium_polyedra.AAC.1
MLPDMPIRASVAGDGGLLCSAWPRGWHNLRGFLSHGQAPTDVRSPLRPVLLLGQDAPYLPGRFHVA